MGRILPHVTELVSGRQSGSYDFVLTAPGPRRSVRPCADGSAETESDTTIVVGFTQLAVEIETRIPHGGGDSHIIRDVEHCSFKDRSTYRGLR